MGLRRTYQRASDYKKDRPQFFGTAANDDLEVGQLKAAKESPLDSCLTGRRTERWRSAPTQRRVSQIQTNQNSESPRLGNR
jgi:hypothetical protein